MWLIRHAESVWNAQGRWQGQADPPLSQSGLAQAAALADRAMDAGFEWLITSDLQRASQTAAALGQRLGLVPQPDPRLRELEAGSWSGLTHAEIEARDGAALEVFRRHDPDARAGGGESWREAGARVATALREFASEMDGERVAVVTHGGVVASLFPGVRLANTEWLVVDVPACFDSRDDAGG